jgi:hypothetical protein
LSFAKGWDSFFADTLGRDLEGGAGELGRKAWKLYRGLLGELPCITIGIRSLVAQRARAATLADHYGRLGSRVGPHSDKGRLWLAEASRWDARSERLAVTTWDLSTRAAAAARKLQRGSAPSSAVEAEFQRMQRAELVESTTAGDTLPGDQDASLTPRGDELSPPAAANTVPATSGEP